MNYNPYDVDGQEDFKPSAMLITGDLNVSMILDGQSHTIGASHPNHSQILDAIREENWAALPDLVDVPAAMASYTDGNVSFNDFGEVEWNGEVIHNSVAERIVHFRRENLPYQPLVRFLENLMANPSMQSRNELYDFLEHGGFQITEDGCFVAYKGIRSDMTDCHTGKFDNSIGSINKMERREVDDDRRRECSYGFHVGTWEYASGFGAVVVRVKVNPADAVAVPLDHNASKLRVCEYEVLAHCEARQDSPMWEEPAPVVAEDAYLDDPWGDEDEEDIW